MHEFSDLIQVGKQIEASIRAGQIIDTSNIQKASQNETPKELKGKEKESDSAIRFAYQSQFQQSHQPLQAHRPLQSFH